MTHTHSSSAIVVPLWINGEPRYSPSTFDVVSPATNTTCWKAAAAGKDETLRAIEAATIAFQDWSKTKPSVRVDILNAAASYLQANIEQYAQYMMVEMGADRGAAQFFVLPTAITLLRDIAARISSVVGIVPAVAAQGQSAMVWKEPYGVTLGVVPWYVSNHLRRLHC
jgi:acyl-CoA reductase-like NAD-dependent aldehyde dehydrogenase